MLTKNEKIFLDRVAQTMINSGFGEDCIDIACKSVLSRDADLAAAILENSTVKKTITTLVNNSAQSRNMREQHEKQLKELASSANLRVAEIFI